MEAAIRKRTAIAACGIALCGALAVPAALEVASAVTDSGQVQVDAVKGPKKPKKPPKPGKILKDPVTIAVNPS
ncbi:hypothetical protein [Streptomyces sp. NPDC003395]